MRKVIVNKVKYDDYINEIPNWGVSEQDKKDVLKFFKDYELGKITNRLSEKSTIEHYILYLRRALEFLNKTATQLSVEDIDKFSDALLKDEIKSGHKTPIAESVKIKIRRTLSQFIEWKIPNKAPLLNKSLNVIVRQKNKTPEFLTEQEIDKLYKGSKDNAERYLIAVLFSSGARRSEFYNIRKSDVELPQGKDNFVKLTLREEFSKTKGRTISLYYKNALEAVNDFLQERIKEGIKPEDPVWNILPTTTTKKLNAFGSFKRNVKDDKGKIKLKLLGRKILDRQIHFHLFRSSCATWLASKLNRNEMCYYFGWRFSSPMPDIYISRRGIRLKEVDETFTQTEMGELKAKLSKQEIEANFRNEKIEILKKRMEQFQKMFKDMVIFDNKEKKLVGVSQGSIKEIEEIKMTLPNKK